MTMLKTSGKAAVRGGGGEKDTVKVRAIVSDREQALLTVEIPVFDY